MSHGSLLYHIAGSYKKQNLSKNESKRKIKKKETLNKSTDSEAKIFISVLDWLHWLHIPKSRPLEAAFNVSGFNTHT